MAPAGFHCYSNGIDGNIQRVFSAHRPACWEYMPQTSEYNQGPTAQTAEYNQGQDAEMKRAVSWTAREQLKQDDIAITCIRQNLNRLKPIFQKAGNDCGFPGDSGVNLKNYISNPLFLKKLEMSRQIVFDIRARP
jgi:hypothetical protein